MNNIVITGAAGFIGSNLAYLVNDKYPNARIYLIDALTYAGNMENIAPLLKEDRVTFHKIDIANSQQVTDFFSSNLVDYVFHLAAESHVDRSIHSAAEFVTTNVLGTQNLLDQARNSKVKRFIHISTDEVYGALGATGKFHETTPLDPTSPYAASKASSDLLVLAAAKTHGFDAVVTRCTNNYGPYQFPEKLIPLFITNALEDKALPVYGDGQQIRHWVYVQDHCEALIAVAERGQTGEVYNIGGPEESELPNLTVTTEILRLLNKPVSLIKRVEDRLAHDRRYCVDISKISKELGWTPKVDFPRGLELTINWYLENKEWWSKIKSGEYLEFYQQHYGKSL